MSSSFKLLAALCVVLWVVLACQAPPDNEPPPSTPCRDAGVADAGAQLVCDGGCIDPRTDPRNCGGCGRPCPQGCSDGVCSPPVQLAVGERHSCVRLASGQLRCWGANDRGQLGDGTYGSQSRPVVSVPTLSGLQAVAAGGTHTCAIASDRTVLCWGGNDRGQLGLGSREDALVPAIVQTAESTQVALGSRFSCALRVDRRVDCWGSNDQGQLGDGTNVDRSAPAPVSGLTDVVRIAAGRDAACALRFDGGVWCWGSLVLSPNGNSQGTRPVLRVRTPGLEDLAVGDAHVCLRFALGQVVCSGSNNAGQLGTGQLQGIPDAPVQGLTDATALYAAGQRTCALSRTRGALCWGRNTEAQGGDGTFLNRAEPVPVLALRNALSLAIGPTHGCALVGVDVLCWGLGADGQLGDGTNLGRRIASSVRW